MPEVWDDISYELSTAYFNMAALKQDHGVHVLVSDHAVRVTLQNFRVF